MPLYKVDFDNNIPASAMEVTGDDFQTLKEFETINGCTLIKWYIVQADNESTAKKIAGKLAFQIWGDILITERKT